MLKSIYKNQQKVNRILLLLTVLVSITSCQREEPITIPRVQPESYNSTTNYYNVTYPFQAATNERIRKDAEGTWKDNQGNIIFIVEKGYFTDTKYTYEVVSNIPEWSYSTPTKLQEIAINGNNINLDNKFRLIVEDCRAWLWVMGDQPYVLDVWRNPIRGSVRN